MHTRTLIFALLLLASTRVMAVDFCVQTDGQLSAALSIAELTPGPNRILLGAGKTLHLANTALDDASYSYDVQQLTIAGGYDATCSVQVTQDAASSVLDGTGLGIANGYNYVSVDVDGSFTLSTLTIVHLPMPLSFHVYGDGARLRVQRVRVVDGGAIDFGSGSGDDVRITVSDSVFARMGDGDSDYALGLFGGPDSARIDLVNTTVTASSRNGVHIVNLQGITSLYNNILYGNAPDFVDLDQNEAVWAFNNTIGSHNGGFVAGSVNNLATNPLFVSATDYNLQFASPARDSGTSAVPGGLSAYDVEGGVRVVGATVDRGAYENDSTGATIVLVTNTNDSGNGSLRQAILDANANPTSNIIGFNIPGSCPRTIAVNTELPAITDNLSIRGYTQPGALANTSVFSDNATICVELVEAAGHSITYGLHFAPSPTSTTQDVSGLAIGNFTTGIRMDGPSSGGGVACSIWGNFIGLAANGTTLRANSFTGIDVEHRASCAIGGDDNAQRNVVAGAFSGIQIAAEQSNFVVNNYIGTTRSGNTARANVTGVAVYSGLNHIDDNLISGNSTNAVMMTGVNGADNSVHGNRVGLKAFAICVPPCAPDFNALPNGSDAILITNASYGNQIADNTIAFNNGAGVRITGDGSTANFIGGNSIYSNDSLGIDLGSAGVDPVNNDATTPPDAPNRGINAPLLNWARGGTRSGTVFGELRTINDDYVIEFFASDECDPSGHGEGRYPLGTAEVTVDNATATANGSEYFYAPITWTNDLPDMAITATVRPAHGSDFSTSEFSGCQPFEFSDLIFADDFDPAQP
jgi:hypothetical protein